MDGRAWAAAAVVGRPFREPARAGRTSGRWPAPAHGADNPELLIKVLNGCGLNNQFWIFFSAGTNVGMVLRVTDTQRGLWVEYENPDLNPVPTVQDTSGMPCT